MVLRFLLLLQLLIVTAMASAGNTTTTPPATSNGTDNDFKQLLQQRQQEQQQQPQQQQQRHEALESLTQEYNARFRPGSATPSNTSSSPVIPTPNDISANSVSVREIRKRFEDFFINLYEGIFTPTTLCRLGFPSTCICNEDALRRAVIRAGISFDNPTGILICAGTITLKNEPINVTDKSFFIGCAATLSRKTCTISGDKQQRMFYGSPTQFFIQNIRLINGYANTIPDNDLGYGGAIYLTGGKTFIDRVTFQNNVAEGAGGAIFVGPSAQLSIASADFRSNRVTAYNGNDTYIPGIGGGAMYIHGGVVIAADGKYTDNTMECRNSNSPTTGIGGAILAYEASIRFEAVTFASNEIRSETDVSNGGGAIAVNRSIAQLAGTIFEENDAGLGGNGDALYIADDLDDDIDGSYVYCDPVTQVSFCYGFDDGSAIYEFPGGSNENTNCREVGLSDIFSERCPNYIP